MIVSSLRRNALSPAAYAWYLDYLAALDARDVEAYAKRLADDVSVSFNNQPAIVGKPAAVAMLGGYWQSFAGLEHELLNIFGDDSSFVLEALNHYVRLDGRRVTTHAVAVTERNAAGLVTSARIYADVSPVFAPAA